jgi:uncharacterized protein
VNNRIPAALWEFASLFNGGEFWESHEVLETPWRQARSDFLQGLILVASAWVHVRRGNPRGIAAQLRKAERRLSPYRPFYLGVDVDTLLAHLERTRTVVTCNAGAPAAAWAGLAPPPEIRLCAALVRGAEPELDR